MNRIKAVNLLLAFIFIVFGAWQMVVRGDIMAAYLPPGADLDSYGIHSWAANVEFGAGALYMLQLGVVYVAAIVWGDHHANRLVLWAGCVLSVMGVAMNVYNLMTDRVFTTISPGQLIAPWLVPLIAALIALRTDPAARPARLDAAMAAPR